MSEWAKYYQAVMAILKLLVNTLPLNELQKRRIAEVQELVEAAGDILRIETEALSDAAAGAEDPEDPGDTEAGEEEFISLKDEDPEDAAYV